MATIHAADASAGPAPSQIKHYYRLLHPRRRAQNLVYRARRLLRGCRAAGKRGQFAAQKTGERGHRLISRLVCAALIALAVLSVVWHSSPVWLVWSLVLLFMLKIGHPPVVEEEPLGLGRIALAVFAIIVFLLCFMPFPITMS